MKKILSFVLCTVIILCSLCVPSFADNSNDMEITPYLNNTSFVDVIFTINSSGRAVVTVILSGYDGITSHADISIKLQKKTSSSTWSDVNIGYTNNTYTSTIYGVDGLDEAVFQLSSKGTYKALVDVTVYGSGGPADLIEVDSEYVYD